MAPERSPRRGVPSAPGRAGRQRSPRPSRCGEVSDASDRVGRVDPVVGRRSVTGALGPLSREASAIRGRARERIRASSTSRRETPSRPRAVPRVPRAPEEADVARLDRRGELNPAPHERHTVALEVAPPGTRRPDRARGRWRRSEARDAGRAYAHRRTTVDRHPVRPDVPDHPFPRDGGPRPALASATASRTSREPSSMRRSSREAARAAGAHAWDRRCRRGLRRSAISARPSAISTVCQRRGSAAAPAGGQHRLVELAHRGDDLWEGASRGRKPRIDRPRRRCRRGAPRAAGRRPTAASATARLD